MNPKSIVAAVLFTGLSLMMGAAFAAQTAPAFFPPALEFPGLLATYPDPAFHARLTRLTDRTTFSGKGICPDYSKRQAFNADESLLLLKSTDGDCLLFDGNSLRFREGLEGIGGDDVLWHPRKPGVLVIAEGNTIFEYSVQEKKKTLLFTFPEYAFTDTRGEGNLSADGRFYALAARTYDEVSQVVAFRALLLLDLTTRKVVKTLTLPPALENFDWVSVSPSGTFIVADYADTETAPFHGVEVYDATFTRLWQKPLGAGHSDLGYDADGTEILLMDRYDAEKNVTFIEKYRLIDGQRTLLLEVSPLFDLHISCRNLQKPGWACISTFDYVGRLSHDRPGFLPLEDEVFLLKTDGSGEVRRLAHHRSRRFSPATPDSDASVYFAEPHATISQSGDRILFGSNFERDLASPAAIDTWMIDLR